MIRPVRVTTMSTSGPGISWFGIGAVFFHVAPSAEPSTSNRPFTLFVIAQRWPSGPTATRGSVPFGSPTEDFSVTLSRNTAGPKIGPLAGEDVIAVAKTAATATTTTTTGRRGALAGFCLRGGTARR